MISPCREPETLNITTILMDAEKQLTLRNVPDGYKTSTHKDETVQPT